MTRPPHPVPARKHAARARPRARILPTMAAMICVAGALRLASGLGEAVALDAAAAAPAPPTPSTETLTPAARPVSSAETAEIVLSLTRREQALQAREDALDDRARSLAEAERRITEQIAALRAAEEALAATMARADRAAEDDIARLVQVYENMKPEEAARVFAEMEVQFAAGFLGRLRPEIAAPILAGLEPRQAYALSAMLAGRNALVPRREPGQE
jgi:flagellar motility protein MotE (MotC chaperone)